MTSASNTLIQAVWTDIQKRCPSAGKLRTLMVYFGSFFALNEIEVAAWNCLLIRLLQEHHTLAQHIANLRMAAYYTKSMLGHSMKPFDEKLAEEDSEFAEVYAEWLLYSHSVLQVTYHEIHLKYIKLTSVVKSTKKQNNTNDVVDDIVAVVKVKSVPSESKRMEEPTRKIRKTEPVPIELEETPFLPIVTGSMDFGCQDRMFDELEELVFDVGRYLS